MVLHYKEGGKGEVVTRTVEEAEAITRHVNAGGRMFEYGNVVYPCKGLFNVVLAEVKEVD